MANGVATFLSTIGKDIKGVFSWLGSAAGQKEIAGVEGAATAVVTAVNPVYGVAMSGVEALINTGLKSVVGVEALAAGAAAQSGTGAQKSAAVASVLSAQSASFLESVGVSDATSEEVQNLSTVIAGAAADILNAIPARAATPATPAA